jgi:hypothetical protein
VTIAIRPSGEWDGTENIRVVRFVTRMMVAEALGGLAEDVTRLLSSVNSGSTSRLWASRKIKKFKISHVKTSCLDGNS